MLNLKVLFIASELTPIAKVGGLGDVAGALPLALKKLGVDIRVALPKYGIIDDKKYPSKLEIKNIKVKIGGKKELVNLYSTLIPKSNVPLYLIDNQKYFGSQGVYGSKTAFVESVNEMHKFIFFSESILKIFEPLKWQPDIIHCNDWHTGILPLLIKISSLKIHPVKSPRSGELAKGELFNRVKTIFTIHNLANQGVWNTKEIFNFLGVTGLEHPNLKKRDKKGDFNLMQQGILNADLINAVSPAYAKEILTPEYGCSLEKNLKKRKSDLYGIVNGIDTNFFNPETDPEIKSNYSIKNLDKKIENKLSLQKELGLTENKNFPLMGIVSRLTYQKGIDLIIKILPDLVKLNCQLVVLGEGQTSYQEDLLKLAKKYPKNISSQIKFDASLAQKIYAGSDIFLMPSLFEPCGLGQLIAMRYGTVPVVRSTGGLKDTVNSKNGFIFKKSDESELLKTIKKSLAVYKKPADWRKLQINGMKQDFSWNKSAKEYIKLYNRLKT